MRGILSGHWDILKSDPRVETMIPKNLLTAKHASNLGNHLVRSHFTRPCIHLKTGKKIRGSYPCGTLNICSHMEPTTKFVNPLNGEVFNLQGYAKRKMLYIH